MTATNKRVSFPIVGSYNVERIPKVDTQETVNLYEVIDPQGKKPNFLAPVPGFEKPIPAGVMPGTGPIRALHHRDGFAYIVSGDSLFRMDSTFTLTPLSPPVFSTSSGPVSVEDNETQIVFCDGTSMLAYTIATTTLSIVNPGFIPADITFMDGYIIAIEKDTNKFFISALNNVLVPNPWNPLDFALVNSEHTTLIGCQRLKRRLFLFGTTITEVWQDAGLADFPFRRDNNLLLEHGLGARGSLAEGFDRMFYLSKDRDGYSSIMMVAGTLPTPISTTAIELKIQEFDDPSDATGFVYRMNGHIFYQINFTTDNFTFVYNVNTNKWHTLETETGDRHPADCHMFFPVLNTVSGKLESRHFIGSFDTNNIYELDNDIYSYDGAIIPRRRVSHVFSSPVYNRIRVDRFMVDLLQGIGEPNPPNNDPQLFLSISYDGGLSYQNYGSDSVGKLGQARTRTLWSRLGAHREYVFKLEFYDALPFYVLGAAIDAAELPE